MFDASCRNILVRGVNWIGDSVMTLPALRALRKSLPESRISLLVKPWVSAVFDHDPDIDEILFYDAAHTGMTGRMKLAWMLHKKKFCSAILFQNAFDAALITFLAGIKSSAGYDRDGRGFLLTEKVPVPGDDKKEHQIFYYLNLLTQLGISAPYSDPYIHLSIDERLRARDMVKGMKRPLLGINPGATYGSAKRWFPERFAEIANWFISDTGGSVVLFGGSKEVAIADDIYKQVIPDFRTSQSLISLAGKTSLRDLISLIAECDVFLTNDSGPMHIAYAVKTPLVALFGSTDPLLTGPPPGGDTNSHVVVKADLSCSPCFGRTCRSNDMRCMYAITSDEVYYGIKKILPHTPAVFFDRDGTLNRDTGYINRREDFHVFQDVTQTGLLKEAGFRMIGISNQSGIARGLVSEQFVQEINHIFFEQYGFDDFYYCPHHPDEHCPCRKPEPGMLFRARAEHGIDLKRSFVVGDKEADMLLAKAVGATSILVQTGKIGESPNADFTAATITEAIEWIREKTNTAGQNTNVRREKSG